jgi:hypothetical protein
VSDLEEGLKARYGYSANGEPTPDRGDAWEPPPAPRPDDEPTGYRFAPVTTAELAARAKRPTWRVEGLLVAGLAGVIGAAKKTLKTSIAVDLTVSQATATPFLGHFTVDRPARTVLISGESGDWALYETVRRVCEARGLRPDDVPALWDFELPQMANDGHMRELEDGLRRLGVESAIIDPLYLALLAGQRDMSASNLFDTGPLLMAATRACLRAGATPTYVHHAGKGAAALRARTGEPLDLDDLSFSGVAEFARQWILLSRREAFDPGTGTHRLWMSAGGSAGQSGLWAVDVEEGTLGKDFGGRRWDVTVRSGTEASEAQAERKLAEKDRRKAAQAKRDGTSVLAALDALAPEGGPVSRQRVRDRVGFSGERFNLAVAALLAEGVLEEAEAAAPAGRGGSGRRAVPGLRRVPAR